MGTRKSVSVNRCRREWDKLASVFSARRWVIPVARTRLKKREENSVDILAKFACGQVSSPRLYLLTKNVPESNRKLFCNRLTLSQILIYRNGLTSVKGPYCAFRIKIPELLILNIFKIYKTSRTGLNNVSRFNNLISGYDSERLS